MFFISQKVAFCLKVVLFALLQRTARHSKSTVTLAYSNKKKTAYSHAKSLMCYAEPCDNSLNTESVEAACLMSYVKRLL